MNLKSKVAGVTGAASGIGGEIARIFCRAGAEVVIADLNQAGAAAVAAELGDVDSAIGIGMDVTDETQVDARMAAAVAAFGVSTCWSATPASTWAADRQVGAAETGICRLGTSCLLPGRFVERFRVGRGSANGSEIAVSEKRERFRISGTRSKRAPITPQAA